MTAYSRWGRAYYARPRSDDPVAAGEALRAAPGDAARWQAYCACMGEAPDLDLLRESLVRARGWSEAQRLGVAIAVLQALGFVRGAPVGKATAIFEAVARPWTSWAFDHGLHDLGLHLEGRIYNEYVKAIESEAHARSTYDTLLPAILRAAQTRRSAGEPSGAQAARGRPKVGYFVHAPNLLAPGQTLVQLFEALRASPAPPFEPVVYAFTGEHAGFESRMAALGVPIVHLDRLRGVAEPYAVVAQLAALRELLREQGVGTLVWASALQWLAYAATMGIAPRFVWYSMKYHVLRVPGIDAYVTHGDGGVREIGGHPWRTLRLSGKWFWLELSQAAQRERAKLGPHRVTLGTLGREEKMADPRFLRSVARLLRDHPDTLYLWSGRREPPEVLRVFEEHGVLDRQRFLGWTDTRLASQMIDVYLDSFPAPGGFTVREAMAAGAAVAFFRSREAEVTGPNGFIRRLLAGEGPGEDVSRARSIMEPAGERLFPVAESPQEYESQAARLIRDDAFRRRVGQANRAWIAAFFEDGEAMLQSHASAVLSP